LSGGKGATPLIMSVICCCDMLVKLVMMVPLGAPLAGPEFAALPFIVPAIPNITTRSGIALISWSRSSAVGWPFDMIKCEIGVLSLEIVGNKPNAAIGF